MDAMNIAATPSWRRSECISKSLNEIFPTDVSKSGSGKILKRLLPERFYFEGYVVATDLRRKVLATVGVTLLRFFS